MPAADLGLMTWRSRARLESIEIPLSCGEEKRCCRKCTLGVHFVPVEVVLNSLRMRLRKHKDFRIPGFIGGVWDRWVEREGIREVQVGI